MVSEYIEYEPRSKAGKFGKFFRKKVTDAGRGIRAKMHESNARRKKEQQIMRESYERQKEKELRRAGRLKARDEFRKKYQNKKNLLGSSPKKQKKRGLFELY